MGNAFGFGVVYLDTAKIQRESVESQTHGKAKGDAIRLTSVAG